MNQTHNPVVTVSEDHKPLDHPGVYIALKLIYYIHCQVTPRQTSATPSLTVTDHHAHHHTLSHTSTHNNNGSTIDHHRRGQRRGSFRAPGTFFFFSFFFSFFFFSFLLMIDFNRTTIPTPAATSLTPATTPREGSRRAVEQGEQVRLEPQHGSSLKSTFFFFFLFWFTY